MLTRPNPNFSKRIFIFAKHVCFLTSALIWFASSCAPTMAASGDEHWDTQFRWPGTTNYCYALGYHNSKLYAGGYNPISRATNSSVNVWDGTRWTSIGAVQGSFSTVYDIEFVGTDIYVGGVFSGVDGVSVSGLAKWNGAVWSSVGGFRGAVFALATDGANLFVGGVFTNAGGSIITNIARWDGANWSAMGAGLGPYYENGSGGVATLLWTGAELYAGGEFTHSGSTGVPALARWNGANWTTVGGGVATGNVVPARVQALAWNGSELFVGGFFSLAGNSIIAVNVAKWNGTAWSAPLGNLNDQVYALATIGNNLYIGGAFTNAGGLFAPGITRWNGSSSSFYSSAGIMSSEVNELLAVGTNLYAGGSFDLANDRVVNHVALRVGSTWSAIGSGEGLGRVGRVVAASTNGIFAGGFFSAAGSSPANRIARWDGTNWWPLGSGLKGTNEQNGTLVNAIQVRGSNVFVCGLFTNAGGVAARSVAKWNMQSSAWAPLGNGVNGSVTTMAVSTDNVYIGGSFTNAGGVPVNRLASWNGTAWSDVGGGVNSNVNIIVTAGNDFYLGGRFTQAGGFVTANRVVRWTASTWQSLGAGEENGLNGTVTAMAVNGSNIYVMGSFTTAGTVPANRVAKWNGSEWSALGSGLSGSGSVVYNDMIFNNGILYVSGNFTNAGGVYAPAIARWDGANWSELGSGLSMQPAVPTALGMAALGNDVYVTGNFIGAGGKDSHFIARWNDQIDFDRSGSLFLSSPDRLPNGNFRFRITANGISSYVVESTTNFNSWTPLLTNSAITFDFIDLESPGNQRYYRSRAR